MSQNLIYHEQKIQHSLNIYKLYILKLPKTSLQYQQLDQIISENKIKSILYFGTELLQHKIDGLEVVLHQSQIDDIVKNIHNKIYIEQQNVGLMCSYNCEKSLKNYFNYMVLMEKIKFEDIQFNLFENFFSKEQLKQCYDDVKKQSQNTHIFSYDLLNTNPNDVQNIFEPTFKSQQSISSQKQTTIFQTENVTSNYQSEMRILGIKDQVVSQFYETSNQDESEVISKDYNSSQQQHKLKFSEQQQSVYKIPLQINFVHFTSQEGFKCLE